MANPKVLEKTLRLQDISHLFEEPDFSPFSDYYAPYSFKNGMDYIVGEMYGNPSVEQINLTVLLSAEQIGPGLEQQTVQAIKKYSEAWAYDAKQEINKNWYKGTRATIVGIIGFIVITVIGNMIIEYPNPWVEALGEGLTVAGWVLLWWPLESLFFDIWENRLEKRAYQALQNIQVSIQPDKTYSPKAG